MHDTSSEQYQIARADPSLPLVSHVEHVTEGNAPQVEITKLENGVTVVSETPQFPGTVDMNYVLDVGTRDETELESGSCLSMKNSYLKTILTTNETINYGMVQQSGGSSAMVYDQETSQYRASCLAHDVVDIFNMISDCALEPKNVVACNVAIEKNKHSHGLETVHNTGIAFRDAIGRTAYGLGGLGNPLNGLQANISNLTATTLQKFQIRNYTPNRIFVGASGVENHQEFVELVANKLSYIPGIDSTPAEREASVYRGGESRVGSTGNTTDIALCFEGAAWNAEHSLIVGLQLASALIGNSNAFAESIHSASSTRAHNNVTSVHNFVDSFGAVNNHFSDSGIWGLRISGQSANGRDMVNALVEQLCALRDGNISSEELARAKNTLKLKMLRGIERPADRLAETLLNVKTFGHVVHPTYLNGIDSLSAQDISNAVSKVLGTNATFVASGGDVEKIQTLGDIVRQYN